MKIAKENNTITAMIEGKLDRTTSPEFEKEMGDYLDDNVKKITLDLSGTIYVSSAGLRVILGLEKKMDNAGGSLIITNVPDLVMEVFTETGLTDILTLT